MKKIDYRVRITMDELTQKMGKAANVVKLICGVANNAAALIMLDANDKMKEHPNYRQRVKMLYKHALDKRKELERNLLYTRMNRFFHLEDMTDETRKIYGKISDAEYFEFWQGMGGRAYTDTRPMVTSLWNKYRLSLIKHNIKYPEIFAWSMVAMAALELACKMYESSVRSVANDHKLPVDALNQVFGGFNLRPVADLWRKALEATDPKTNDYELDEMESRNIQFGLIQLEEAWSDPNGIFDMAAGATEDFEEVFRTKGEWKKALRTIKESKQRLEWNEET